jgi:hypothetical protein
VQLVAHLELILNIYAQKIHESYIVYGVATSHKVWSVLPWLPIFDHMKMVIIYYDLIVIDFHLFLACILPFDHDNALLVIGINILLHEIFGQSSLVK